MSVKSSGLDPNGFSECFKGSFIYLFVFGCAGSLLLRWPLSAAHRQCSGFSPWCLLLWSLGCRACRPRQMWHVSSVKAPRLWSRLYSCGTGVCGMWDLPRPGIDLLHWHVDSLPLNHQKSESCSDVSDSLQLHGPYSPWNSPGQNTGVGKPFPSPGDLPNPGIEPRSPALQVDSLPATREAPQI